MCVFQANLQGYRCPALSLCITTMHNIRAQISIPSLMSCVCACFKYMCGHSHASIPHICRWRLLCAMISPYEAQNASESALVYFARACSWCWPMALTTGLTRVKSRSLTMCWKIDTKYYHIFLLELLLVVFQPPLCVNPHSKCFPVYRYVVALLLQHFKLHFLVSLHSPFLCCVPQLKMIGPIRCKEKQFITLRWQEL